MSSRLRTLVLTLLTLLVLLFTTPLLAAEPPIIPPRDDAELQQRLGDLLTSHSIAGMGAVITDRSGPRWIAGIGKANVATSADATPDTLFRVGSISKMFVGLAALKLVSEGKLRLDATVRDLAPEVKFDNRWESTDPVRVVHLLEHTTGWDDLTLKEWAHDDPKPATLQEALDVDPKSRTSRWRPGTRYAYTSAGPAVAAYIMEEITGKTFEAYVAETFFKPLRMPTASFLLTPETDKLLTRLYRDDGRTEYPYFHFLMRPSGSLNASPREMSNFLMFLLNRGRLGDTRILDDTALDRMETPTTDLGAQAGLRIGYGLHNGSTLVLDDAFVWHGHNGGLPGTRADLEYMPDAGVGYFFAINGDDDGAFKAIGKLIRAYITKDLTPPALPPAAPMSPEARSYAGFYELAAPREEMLTFAARLLFTAKIDVTESGLFVKAITSKLRGDYVPTSPTLYRRSKSSAASLALLPPGPEGRMIVINGVTMKAIPAWMAWVEILLTPLCLLLMASVPAFALVWIPRRLLGQMKDVKHLSARVWPLLAVVALVGTVWLYQSADVLGALSLRSVGFTACTVLFAGFSLVSLVMSVRVPRREVNRGAYLHMLLCAGALSVVTVYLLYWGVIGFRPWV